MTHLEIRQKFLEFFEKKGHKIVSSSSLIPDDPSVLFTSAGMQQFKNYYTGQSDAEKDFGSLNTISIQKCFRTSDIDEVGDETHDTFFEMLGNFSFGGYWKKKAIEYAHEFITKEMALVISYVTVFEGSGKIPKDEESKKIWQSLGVKDIREEGMEDVFWGPTGDEGPCGPTTEIYCKNSGGQDVEIWNIVFNEFLCDGSREQLLDGKAELKPLAQKGIDTGMGLERLAMISQNKPNIFETDLFQPITEIIPGLISERSKRIMADHARASAFLITDGVRPSNKEQGYVLRRLMRRVITHNFMAKTGLTLMQDVFRKIVGMYGQNYPELNESVIIREFDHEKEKFEKTLSQGLKELKKMESIDAQAAFRLYESFGLPYEVIKELGGETARKLNRKSFDQEFKKHQEISRAGREKKFGGHGLLLDTGELKAANNEEVKIVTRLHTATHLLHAALRKILGSEVKQAGSDITAERLRFDFTFARKLSAEEIKKIESLINQVIAMNLEVSKQEMPYQEALKTGALSFFKLKYPDIVNVYSVGDFSKELCGGPHVASTKEIGHFRITKEESASSGIRRIRAVVE